MRQLPVGEDRKEDRTKSFSEKINKIDKSFTKLSKKRNTTDIKSETKGKTLPQTARKHEGV